MADAFTNFSSAATITSLNHSFVNKGKENHSSTMTKKLFLTTKGYINLREFELLLNTRSLSMDGGKTKNKD